MHHRRVVLFVCRPSLPASLSLVKTGDDTQRQFDSRLICIIQSYQFSWPTVPHNSSSSPIIMSLLTTRTLSLAVADEISSLVVKAALANKFNPISVCILDNAGNEIVSKRMDGCPVSVVLVL
jgi:hypothetical protein